MRTLADLLDSTWLANLGGFAFEKQTQRENLSVHYLQTKRRNCLSLILLSTITFFVRDCSLSFEFLATFMSIGGQV